MFTVTSIPKDFSTLRPIQLKTGGRKECVAEKIDVNATWMLPVLNFMSHHHQQDHQD